MDFQLINIGFGNTVLAHEVIAVVSPESAPIKRIIQDARTRGRFSDATKGRQVRAVIITNAGSQRSSRGNQTTGGSSKAILSNHAAIDRDSVNSATHATNPQGIRLILAAIQPETVAHRFVFDRNRYFSRPPSFEPLDSMDIKLINIGFGNIVSANRVIAIVSPESAPIKRIITDARDRGQLVDATYGRRTRAVIITDYGHIILSAIQPETVANRFVISKDGQSSDD